MTETLYEIKSLAKAKLEIVKKSPYRMFDRKCHLMERYEDIIDMCEKLEKLEPYIKDDKLFNKRLNDLMKEKQSDDE